LEHDLEALQYEYHNLEREIGEKEELLQSYEQDQPRSNSTEIANLKSEIKDLQNEINQLTIEKVDMEDQIQSLKNDAQHLIEKDVKRSEERANLQTKIEQLEIRLRQTTDDKVRAEIELNKEIDRMEQRLLDARLEHDNMQSRFKVLSTEHPGDPQNVISLLFPSDPSLIGHKGKLSHFRIESLS
jgi:chromosome segregation ATPase